MLRDDGLVARDQRVDRQHAGNRHHDQRQRGDRGHTPYLSMLFALLQLLEADSEHAGDELPRGACPDVLS
ncbi:MAG: hypothetical protein ACREP2_15105, partial [Rhodanobacteraceae bacterium]